MGGGTLWLVDGSDREARDREAQLRQTLDAARGNEHLVGLAGVEDHIKRFGLDIPSCLDGTGSCDSNFAAAVQALDIQLVVRLEIQRDSSVIATAYDADGALVRSLHVEARNARQAVMRAVSEITGATGQLLVTSEPAGATVYVEGTEIGQTPLNRTLAVGSYNVDVMMPGYGAVHDTIDVPPNGSARRAFNLTRLQATLTVRSGTPEAFIRIDDDPTRLPLNEPLLLDPGPRRITVEADGYDSVTERFDFEPGQERELSATLAVSMRELTARRTQAIRDRPIMLQLGMRYTRYGTNWAEAVRRGGGAALHCSAEPNSGACANAPVNAIGFEIGAIYAWRYLELEGFGLSYQHLAQDAARVGFRIDERPDLLVRSTGSRMLFRIGHVGGRYLVNEYLEPYARVGFSFAADRLRLEDHIGGTGTYRYRRPAVLLEVRAGVRLRVNQLLYGYADMGVAIELLHRDTRAGFEIGAGVGVNLENPFNRAGRGGQDRARRGAHELPEEL